MNNENKTRKRIELETEELSNINEDVQANNPVTQESMNKLWDHLLKKQAEKKESSKLNKKEEENERRKRI